MGSNKDAEGEESESESESSVDETGDDEESDDPVLGDKDDLTMPSTSKKILKRHKFRVIILSIYRRLGPWYRI